uniref:Uncharacterized protein n=1 Tax=Glossina palpalis gambiensis TaxID=67801 RepID=A0A1B0AKM2_9MUSC
MNDSSVNLQQQLVNLQSQLMDYSVKCTPDNHSVTTIANDYLHTSVVSLWSIDDDGLFCAQGLVNHSGGKKSSVFVVWDENYILNFVFKTSSKTQITTLTKVQIPLPCCKGDIEEIQHMLITDFNTLLLMKSGRMYYFSSVKLMHQLKFLEGVRCVTFTKPRIFSVIRLQMAGPAKQLCLQVFQDVYELGKATYPEEFLLRSYDISFDERNLFDCNWEDENFSLITLMVNADNQEFLNKLIKIGQNFLDGNEQINLTMQQELHIFTISGNVFILTGAVIQEDLDKPLIEKVIENHHIHLLSAYASNVECVKLDCAKQFLIVLLQCGYIDVWFGSNQQFKDTLQLRTIQITTFTHYDFCASSTTFYFVMPDQINQLKISINEQWRDGEEECLIHEEHKAISGIIACTWAEHLQQLVCISYNNIFYHITFHKNEFIKHSENSSQHDNSQELHALTKEHVQELLQKAQVIGELIEQSSLLHQQIEDEYKKQVSIAMGHKTELLRKYYKAYVEYYNYLPSSESYQNSTTLIKTHLKNNQKGQNKLIYYALIFFKLNRQDKSVLSAFTDTNWYLQLSTENESMFLFLSDEMLKRNLCLLVECNLQEEKIFLSNFQAKLFTFVKHASNYFSVNFVVELEENETSFQNMFSHKVDFLSLWSPISNLRNILQKNLTRKSEMTELATVTNYTCTFTLQNREHGKKVLQNLNLKMDGLTEDLKLYFLAHYLIVLKYDISSKTISITSEFPEALYYLKLYFLVIMKTNNLQCSSSDSLKRKQVQIMEYQSEIERLYGFVLVTDVSNAKEGTNAIHLERLKRVYTKIRQDLREILL